MGEMKRHTDFKKNVNSMGIPLTTAQWSVIETYYRPPQNTDEVVERFEKEFVDSFKWGDYPPLPKDILDWLRKKLGGEL